jgi:multisubunit Na+/H+ antiporter MnhE subunit
MSEAGASILGGMITLTPGTTTIDVDMERREMLLHVLDASRHDGAGRRHPPRLRALPRGPVREAPP